MTGQRVRSDGGVSLVLPEGWLLFTGADHASALAGRVGEDHGAAVSLVSEPSRGTPAQWWRRQRTVVPAVIPMGHVDVDDGWYACYAYTLLGASLVGLSRVMLLPGRTLTATGAAPVASFEAVEELLLSVLASIEVEGVP